jgi:hypothetical protein
VREGNQASQFFSFNQNKNKMKKIGLSLSLCIRDIVLNREPQGETLAIIAGTAFKEEGDWKEQVIDMYSKSYWKDLDLEFIRTLLNNIPIVQPRNFGLQGPDIPYGHWIVMDGKFSNGQPNIEFQTYWEQK